jgi:hypothetical protein
MEYGTPQKLPDGRYFLKITGVTHQVNNLTLQDNLENKTVNFKVSEGSDLFSKIDQDILTRAKTSKMEWFGKELSDETIMNAFQESVTDGILGANLASVKGQIVTTVFDSAKNVVERQDVKTDTKCDVLIELSGLWFLKKSFGPIWRVIQIRVRGGAVTPIPKEYMFTDEPEDDDPADYLD